MLQKMATFDVGMSGVIGVSSTALLRSLIKSWMRLYVLEWMKACKSDGETICFVGTTNEPVMMFLRKLSSIDDEPEDDQSRLLEETAD